MSFAIRGLDPAPFVALFGKPDAELEALGIHRRIADRTPGFPDRVALDAYLHAHFARMGCFAARVDRAA